MGNAAPRVVDWLSRVVELLREPSPRMPGRTVMRGLTEVFDVNAVAWHWRDEDGRLGVTFEPADLMAGEADMLERWCSGELVDCNALLTWYTVTNNAAPQTTARVPTALVPRARRVLLEKPLRRLGLEQQMTVNYRLDGTMHRSFVLGRGGRDFSEADLHVARYAQRSLVAVDQQARTLHDLVSRGGSLDAARALGLTGREIAILFLVAEGCPTRAIARRLGCDPTAVEMHLSRAQRTLGVRDRGNAVRQGVLASVLPPTAPVEGAAVASAALLMPGS